MSEGVRVSLAYARRVAGHFAASIGAAIEPTATGPMSLGLVGSVRRCQSDVGDVEFIAPHPGDGADLLWEALAARFWSENEPPATVEEIEESRDLFGAPVVTKVLRTIDRGARIGPAKQGLRRGFWHARLVVECQHPDRVDLPVEVYRYVPGPEGNRGWIELIRTGPWEWSKACMIRWKSVCRGGSSEDGFPHVGGRPIPVPSEAAAFELLRMPFIEPHMRHHGRVPGYKGTS